MTAVPNWDIVGPAGTDADLARAAAAGDRAAFAGIYDRYADRLHDFCVGMLRDRDGAADCVQDTFCIAATRLQQLQQPDKLRPWLYAIARNEALRRIRERRRETPSDELPDAVSHEPGPDTLAARTELADLIAEAAGGLSDRDRAVLELVYRHGLDGPDLAEALGVSPTNATKMAYRLRETVERSLGALLVSRRARNTGGGCPELASILEGWDGPVSEPSAPRTPSTPHPATTGRARPSSGPSDPTTPRTTRRSAPTGIVGIPPRGSDPPKRTPARRVGGDTSR